MKKTAILLLTPVLFAALPVAGLAADAATNWTGLCKSCHGADGAGHTKPGKMLGAKDLTDAQYQKSFTDDQAVADLTNGLQKDGKTKMKPFSEKLSPDDIKALVAYVRTLAK